MNNFTEKLNETWLRLPPSLATGDAADQLNQSESLLAELTTPTLWWYSAGQPSLILGAAQKQELLNLEQCEAEGLEMIKRMSGGALVLAEPDFLSLDIALPQGHPLAPADITETYHWLGSVWLETLERLGVKDLRLVPVEEVRGERRDRDNYTWEELHDYKLASLVCFGTLSPYEVVQGKRKLVGLSQVRRRNGTLLQAGIPLRTQAARFARYLKLEEADKLRLDKLLPDRLTGLDELLPGNLPTKEEIIQVFELVLLERLGVNLAGPD